MNRTTAVILAGAALFAFAAGLLVGRYGLPGLPADRPGVSRDDRVDGVGVRRPFQEIRGAGARRPGPAVVEGFAFQRLVFDTSGDRPKACFQFSEKLDESGKTNYGDYIRLTPSVKPAVEVNGQNLCVSGLAFDVDYTATLKKGLPGAKGQALEGRVLSQAVQLYLNDQLVVKDKKVIFRPGRFAGPAEAS